MAYQRDARGNMTTRDVAGETGDCPLRFTYDGAGRAIQVEEEVSTGFRVLKEFFYARANIPGNGELRRGQLVMARRTNWVAGLHPLLIEGGAPLVVTDHYQYGGLGGRVSKKTTSISLPSGGQSFSSEYTYGLLGDIATLDYPSGDWPHQSAPQRSVSYSRRLGFLTAIPGYATSINYQLGGMLHEIQYPNGARWRQTAEAATGWERPDKIETFAGSTLLWSTGDYGYDGAGNISAIGTRDYVYDVFSRFAYVRNNGALPNEQQASYDAYGNLTALAKSGSTRVLTTNPATNRLAIAGASYTSNGELAAATIDGAAFAYHYDGLGQQLFQQSATKTWLHIYDANDERVMTWECAQNLCGEETSFERYTLRGLGGELLRSFEGRNRGSLEWKEDYVYRDGQPLAWIKAPAEGTGEIQQYLHADHLGSTRQVTSAAGTQVSRHDFLPFGEESTAVSGGDVDLKFTGHERDQPGKPHDYMHARFSSPLLGRFLTIDPVIKSGASADPQMWNRYSYTSNNPMNRKDPDGRNWFYINSTWEWHQGESFTDANGKAHSSNYTHLLVAQATGVSKTGATLYDLTLYSQNNVLIRSKAFSGGNGSPPIPSGNFTIRGDIRDQKGPDHVNPDSPLHNPPQFYGIQVIRRDPLPDPGTGITWNVLAAYGPMRAHLNPWDATIPNSRGNFLHGQDPSGPGSTHGCLCYGQDTAIIDYLWKLGARVPVSVDGNVSHP